jgi:hypothetical protein
MKTKPKSVAFLDELIERCDGPNQFEKFDQLSRAVISAPRSDIVKEKAKWKRAHARNKRTK